MRKMKYIVGILVLFMVIGFATVTVSLSISGNAKITGDIDNFKVYFSDVKVNDEQDLTLVKSETELSFDFLLDQIGKIYKITYDVTNGSNMFDASLSISCTQGDEYVSVVNSFDTSTLSSLSTRTGNLTIKKLKSVATDTDTNYSITCTIVATPLERDSEGSGTVIAPVQPIPISTGDVISIDGENFNVISQTDTTVTMLAQYNLDYTDFRQDNTPETYSLHTFSNSSGWEYTPGSKEIDIQIWSGVIKTYVNEYVSYLQSVTGNENLKGDLITLSQLSVLGCYIQDDYSYTGAETCVNSNYFSWLDTDAGFWTKSTSPDRGYVWFYYPGGSLGCDGYNDTNKGVRPVITVPIEIARKYYEYKWYDIGEEIAIEDEMFNVISDNGDTVTMLAQYNLDTDYRQSETINNVRFADVGASGWEYTPGPKEIDIQTWSTNPKVYVNEYVSYLREQTGDLSLSGDLITLNDLKRLGCDIPDDYSSSISRCSNVYYNEWLFNDQYSWTRSAVSSYDETVWMIDINEIYPLDSLDMERGDGAGIRPIITISKDYI